MDFPITAFKFNPGNPRVIKGDKFNKLKESLRSFPEMMAKRPMVCVKDRDGKIYPIGGNMRLRAIKDLGFNEVPENWVIFADEWTDAQRREFIVKDNVAFGEWDWDVLAEQWDADDLVNWGLDIPGEKEKGEQGEFEFSQELDEESNYVVLKFTKDIDFLHIQTLLGLGHSYAKRQNGKPWSKGIGRVVDGVDAILKIKEA